MQDKALSEIYEWLAETAVPTLREVIDRKKEALGIGSDSQLASLLGIERMKLERLISGETQKADLFTLVKLDEFLGIGIQEIVRVYVSSLHPEHVRELERARNASYIMQHFDLAGLKKVGFIDSTVDFEHIERRITTFFELESVTRYHLEVGDALFSRTKSPSHDQMREFWVRSAIHQFKRIDNPNEFDLAALKGLIPKIRPYTRFEEKGMLNVIRALYNVGVTVIVQPYLAKTQVRGGTFVVKNKPCIVVTDFNKSYATLWFALMHELFHVLYDFESLKRGLAFHLTGEADLLLMREDDADYFACEMLFRQEKLDYIRHMINSPALVAAYAEQNKVHPAIIYAFYCHHELKQRKRDVYAQYRQYFGKPDKTLRAVQSNPYDKETISQEIAAIKRTLEVTV